MFIDHPVLYDDARTPPDAVTEAAAEGLRLRALHRRSGAEAGV